MSLSRCLYLHGSIQSSFNPGANVFCPKALTAKRRIYRTLTSTRKKGRQVLFYNVLPVPSTDKANYPACCKGDSLKLHYNRAGLPSWAQWSRIQGDAGLISWPGRSLRGSEMTTDSSILASGKCHGHRRPVDSSSWGSKRVGNDLPTKQQITEEVKRIQS